jgi:hypothetical protein
MSAAAPTDTLTPRTVTRTLLFQASGRDAADLVSAELARLEAAYLKAFKRKMPVECLFVSHWGERPNSTVGITAYTTPDQTDILAYLRATVSVSPASATLRAAA